MSAPKVCEQCGTPLPAGGPLNGQCPRCLLNAGLRDEATQLTPGAQLGPYEIVELLGAGGMGAVYKARDTRLGRAVAVKVCREQFTSRFEREARTISALNHSRICTLYDVGPNYLVMELLEGETLAARLRKGALSIDLVVRYGAEIADALAAAHAVGVIHRDLKPGNIMLTKAGVKVLDFGLAKFIRTPNAPPQQAETLTQGIMGTPAYMAPEQLEGKETDARVDIFSLGLVLYEMATGKPAFAGDSQAALIASVMRCEPPLLEGVPEKFAHVVERCLKKDPDSRWQTASDIRAELEWAGSAVVAVAVAAAKRNWWWPSIAAAAVLAALGVAVLWLRQPARLDLSTYHYRPFAFTQEQERFGSWSPDGKSIAYMLGEDRLVVQPLEGGAPTRLTSPALWPFVWSPDGARIYFHSPREGIRAVSSAGGQSELIFQGDRDSREESYDVSPDGKALVIWRVPRSQDGRMRGSVWISSPPGAAVREYTPDPFATDGEAGAILRFSPNGKLLYLSMRAGTGVETWVLPFPPGSGQPRQLFRNLLWNRVVEASWMPDNQRLVLSGNLAPLSAQSLWLADTRSESLTKLVDGSAEHWWPTVSPDGRRLLLARVERDSDIVELPLDGSPPRKLLATTQREHGAAWSPKGGEFAYVTERNGPNELWVRSVSGNWDRPVVTATEFPTLLFLLSPAFSPDGARIAYTVALAGAGNQGGLYISPAAGGTPIRISGGFAPSWSPDGASIAFVWNRPGGAPVAATLRIGSNQTPFELPVPCDDPPVWSPSGEWIACPGKGSTLLLVSPDGKATRTLPRMGSPALAWSKDSQTIYGIPNQNGRTLLGAVDVRTGAFRRVAEYGPELAPRALFSVTALSLSPDGKSLALATENLHTDLWILEGFAK